MNYMILAIIVAALLAACAVFFLRNAFRPKLSTASRSLIEKKWGQLASISDTHRRVLEADAVLDLTFRELGFQGSLGDKLKKAGKYLPNEDAVWKAHKMRNRIAHEPGHQLSESEAAEALKAFRKGIDAFIRK